MNNKDMWFILATKFVCATTTCSACRNIFHVTECPEPEYSREDQEDIYRFISDITKRIAELEDNQLSLSEDELARLILEG